MDDSRTIGTGTDLSNDVTVFVTTVGAPMFAECLEHLRGQDVVARFELIDHVAPLPAALQLMLDRCTTPHFVQVDEDMLLDRDAIGRLYSLVRDEWPDVAVVVGQIEDPHLGRAIEGVKISRHGLVSKVPWNGHATVFERNRALEEAGFRIARRPIPGTDARMTFGKHVLDPRPENVFERYRQLEEMRLSQPSELEWFAAYPAEFLRRLLSEHDEADFYALMGVISARLANAEGHAEIGRTPKDYRRSTLNRAAIDGLAAFWSASREDRDRP